MYSIIKRVFYCNSEVHAQEPGGCPVTATSNNDRRHPQPEATRPVLQIAIVQQNWVGIYLLSLENIVYNGQL